MAGRAPKMHKYRVDLTYFSRSFHRAAGSLSSFLNYWHTVGSNMNSAESLRPVLNYLLNFITAYEEHVIPGCKCKVQAVFAPPFMIISRYESVNLMSFG